MSRFVLIAMLALVPATARAVPATFDVRVAWSEIRSTGGCYFFSGPQRTGRDTHLEDRASVTLIGDTAVIAWGTARFEGSLQNGRLAVRRVGSYRHLRPNDFETTERIEGTFRPGEIVASYHYDECEIALRSSACPGRCTIDAHLEARP
jgi:hypothetical protein